MGTLAFLVPDQYVLPTAAAERAYLTGSDGIPWRGRVEQVRDQLVAQATIPEACQLVVPWRPAQQGEVMLSTGTLVARSRPYHLVVELARGTLARVQRYTGAWTGSGLIPPDDALQTVLQQAGRALARAVTRQGDVQSAAQEADDSLQASLQAIERLCAIYAQQVSLRRTGPTHRLLGVRVNTPGPGGDPDALLRELFDLVFVPTSWRAVEQELGRVSWQAVQQQVRRFRKQNLPICLGPLLELDDSVLPDWLYLWEDDFEAIQSYVQQYVQTAARHWSGKIGMWHVAAGINSDLALSLREEQRVQLVVDAVEALRQVDQRTPTIVSFRQPWGDYVRRAAVDLTPLQFADMLVRGGLGVSALGLELQIGYWPRGSSPRDLLEVHRLVDQWAQLGLPLVIFLAVPSSTRPAARAAARYPQVLPDLGGGPSPQVQAEIVGQLLSLFSCKPAVHAIVYNEFQDHERAVFGAAGIFDQQGVPKPLLQVLRSRRT